MNIFVKLVVNGTEVAVESALLPVALKAHASNPALTQGALAGLKAFTDWVKPMAAGTATDIDDEIVRFLEELDKAAAKECGITL